MYLHDWGSKGFFGMVMDFEGIYMTEAEYTASAPPYANHEAWEELKAKTSAALSKPEWQGLDVLLASYSYANYSGNAFVLFRRDGNLYEVNGGHCSCYGLESQWAPSETTVASLMHRLDNGTLGKDEYCGNEFAKELREVLSALGDEGK